jgi:hypothetical protein
MGGDLGTDRRAELVKQMGESYIRKGDNYRYGVEVIGGSPIPDNEPILMQRCVMVPLIEEDIGIRDAPLPSQRTPDPLGEK